MKLTKIEPKYLKKHNPRIGLITLASDFRIEKDFNNVIYGKDIDLYCNRIKCYNPLTNETLKKMADDIPKVTEDILPDQQLDCVAYGCTSGTIAAGYESIEKKVKAAKPNAKLTTPSSAAIKALKKFNVKKLAIFTTMLKNKILVGSFLATLFFSTNVSPVQALELDEDTRTVTLDSKGNNVVITPEQVKRGKRLFNNACGTCHVGGQTKTNPNVGLDTESLSLATPPRDNITSLVGYMKEPMTYDGLDSISELHPSIKSADIFPKMRSLTDEDLFAIAGHILLQPKVVNEKWGGGKIYY